MSAKPMLYFAACLALSTAFLISLHAASQSSHANRSPQLIDPRALQTGLPLTPDAVASSSVIVTGVAADGKTEVILRIPASHAQQTVNVTVINDLGTPSTSVHEDGSLLATGDTSSSAASHLSLLAIETQAAGPEAFAIYRAPVNFSRGSQDDTRKNRSVTLEVSLENAPAVEVPVMVKRPPVILIHGLWANASSFDGFKVLTKNPNFNVSRASYDNVIPDVTRIEPFPWVATAAANTSSLNAKLPNIRANSLGFEYNARLVLAQIYNYIDLYRRSEKVACVSADIVAHSMGGDIARTMYLLPQASAASFGAGPINKLITISTPHLGSPLPNDLMDRDNFCVRQIFGFLGQLPIRSAAFSGITVNGAMTDLQGDAHGQLSPALTRLNLRTGHEPFRSAYIAGVATEVNVTNLNCTLCVGQLMKSLCPGDRLVKDLTRDRWLKRYSNSDGIVPAVSSTNRLGGIQFSGMIHSSSLEYLGFDAPAVLDANSRIPERVISMLNEDPAGPDFH